MMRIIHALAIAAFVAAAPACALDDGLVDEAEASEPLDESVAAPAATDEEPELTAPDQAPELAAPDSGDESGEFEAAACRPTYYDGCRQAHQSCRCQNTGWAGFCAWELGDNFCAILSCHCD